MTKPPVTPAHTGCTHPKKCVARRCTNGCGELEHKKPAELPEGCLWHDLAKGYVEGGWCGPGLIVQLRVALGRPSAARRGEGGGGTRNAPGSRVLVNCDAFDLLADIEKRSRTADEDTLRDWRRQARTILGFAIKKAWFPEAHCLTCGEHTLFAASDGGSDLWCENLLCHDSDKHEWCYLVDELDYPYDFGYGTVATGWSCRPTEKSLTHNVRWKRDSWAWLWNQINSSELSESVA